MLKFDIACIAILILIDCNFSEELGYLVDAIINSGEISSFPGQQVLTSHLCLYFCHYDSSKILLYNAKTQSQKLLPIQKELSIFYRFSLMLHLTNIHKI